MSHGDITGRRLAAAAAVAALLVLLLCGLGAACGSRRQVLMLVGHDYLFEGTVLDARSGRPLDGAVLTLAV